MVPEGVQLGQHYVATVEGRRSIRMTLDFKTSHTGNQRCYTLGNMEVEPNYVVSLVPCVQAIPHVCTATPDLLPSFGPSPHWMQDLRDSVVSTLER